MIEIATTEVTISGVHMYTNQEQHKCISFFYWEKFQDFNLYCWPNDLISLLEQKCIHNSCVARVKSSGEAARWESEPVLISVNFFTSIPEMVEKLSRLIFTGSTAVWTLAPQISHENYKYVLQHGGAISFYSKTINTNARLH